ncbi:protein kinase [bacterium]|nr:protein kinase [bacterium]
MTERDIFVAALDQPAPARAAFLDAACGGDPALRAKVEALLQSHDAAGSFLGTPVVEPPDPAHAATRVYAPSTGAGAAGEADGDPDAALTFLAPPGRPDSLGRIGHYEVLQVVGKGAFGIVLRAFDDVLQRVVAVKMLAPQLAATSPARKRFLREARSSAQVRHENVVHVYEVGEQPLPYLVMEFIPGETLQQRLTRTGPLDAAEVVRIGRQVAEGLAAAHANDLIHRDIKPGNLLLEGGQHRVKITDFGLARAVDDASTSQSGIIAGTPTFMSPEQARGDTLDTRSDLFSLGSVLYTMAAGHPPFRANNTVAVLKRVAEDTPRPIREVIPETPPWLCNVISKLHAKAPAGRYQSAREVADVLADCEAQLKVHAKLKDYSRIPRRTAHPSGRRKWVAAAVLLLPAVVLAVIEFAGVTNLLPSPRAATGTGAGVTAPPPGPPAAAAPGPEPLPPTFTNGVGMRFVLVPKGRAWLGGGKDRPGDAEVEIPADFYLGRYEVAQADWEAVMGENPSHFSRAGGGADAVKDVPDADLKWFPVESVSWDDCQVFVERLNRREKESGWVYRLPTAAEWEYACRGGPMADRADSAFDYYFARPKNVLLPESANFNTAQQRTCRVGSYEANRLGAFDLHGNVHEWCADAEPAADGTPARVTRGGCWDFSASACTAAFRDNGAPGFRHFNLGFRVARVPVGGG